MEGLVDPPGGPNPPVRHTGPDPDAAGLVRHRPSALIAILGSAVGSGWTAAGGPGRPEPTGSRSRSGTGNWPSRPTKSSVPIDGAGLAEQLFGQVGPVGSPAPGGTAHAAISMSSSVSMRCSNRPTDLATARQATDGTPDRWSCGSRPCGQGSCPGREVARGHHSDGGAVLLSVERRHEGPAAATRRLRSGVHQRRTHRDDDHDPHRAGAVADPGRSKG